MKNIAVFGAGGLGKEVVTTIERMNRKELKWNFVGFYDDGKEKGSLISHFGTVLGGMNELNEVSEPLDLVIAIGSPHVIRSVRERITNHLISYPNIIWEPFGCADRETFKMGEGNIIQGGSWMSVDVTIGNFNVLNGMDIIGHDTTIGDYNVIMPDVRVSGEVKIGNENLLGIGSIVLQQIKIGDGVRLGAGSVLMTKPKNGELYLGNPAKLFRF
jgi:sugar O-acyltransferase (sialic acid O-acetyltransferase NeuD family)